MINIFGHDEMKNQSVCLAVAFTTESTTAVTTTTTRNRQNPLIFTNSLYYLKIVSICLVGTASRKCSKEGTWKNANFTGCSSAEFKKLTDVVRTNT